MGISTRIRCTGTFRILLPLLTLLLSSAAHALALYDGSSTFTLEVTSISGSFTSATATQWVVSDSVVEVGDGSATNTTIQVPGGITTPLSVGDVFTSMDSTSGSAGSGGSEAGSSFLTNLLIDLATGSIGATIDFAYEYSGTAAASVSSANERAFVVITFLLENYQTGVDIEYENFFADSLFGPGQDSKTVSGTFSLSVPADDTAAIYGELIHEGRATVTVIPVPATLALLGLGLVLVRVVHHR